MKQSIFNFLASSLAWLLMKVKKGKAMLGTLRATFSVLASACQIEEARVQEAIRQTRTNDLVFIALRKPDGCFSGCGDIPSRKHPRAWIL